MLSAPTLLEEKHELDLFDSGDDSLDEWLRRRARANQISGASGALKRNMPDPIPMAILGRLAIDKNWQGKGLGAALLQDAVLRASQAAHIMGIRGLLVHAISDEAKAFYEDYGLRRRPPIR